MDEYLKPINELLNTEFNWLRIIVSFFILLFSLIVKKVFDHYISKKMKSLARLTSFRYDDDFINAITPPVSALTFAVGLYIALKVLGLPNEPLNVDKFLNEAFKVALALIAIWIVYRLVDVLAHLISDHFLGEEDDDFITKQFLPLVRKALRIFTVITGVLLIIQNLGYSVTSLLTGLGIGGLAVALGAQESLANFFGSLILLTDRPFKVGEWIRVGDVDGDVEALGFRSTRVRTWGKSLVTIPNKNLANSTIENWSAMPKRRVKQVLGFTYDSSPEQIRNMVSDIENLIKNEKAVDQEFFMVKFTDFNASSLDILVYYFTVTTAWADHLEVRQKMNLSLMELAQKNGLSFAFPSRSVYFGDQNIKIETQSTPN